jgi:hypothetical protein
VTPSLLTAQIFYSLKPEHAFDMEFDMETAAVLAVTLQDANAGDTTTIQQTLIAVAEHKGRPGCP